MARLQKVKEVFMLLTAGDGKQLKLHVWEKNARKGFLKKGSGSLFWPSTCTTVRFST